jgi:hypothetical protein
LKQYIFTPDMTHESSPQNQPAEPKRKSFFARIFRFPRSWKEVRQLGWKFILAFIAFYLIRDLILYVLIPYLIYEGFMSK